MRIRPRLLATVRLARPVIGRLTAAEHSTDLTEPHPQVTARFG